MLTPSPFLCVPRSCNKCKSIASVMMLLSLLLCALFRWWSTPQVSRFWDTRIEIGQDEDVVWRFETAAHSS